MHATKIYEWEVQGYYQSIYGWELLTTEDTKAEAQQRLKEYNETEPQYRHRIIKREVRN